MEIATRCAQPAACRQARRADSYCGSMVCISWPHGFVQPVANIVQYGPTNHNVMTGKRLTSSNKARRCTLRSLALMARLAALGRFPQLVDPRSRVNTPDLANPEFADCLSRSRIASVLRADRDGLRVAAGRTASLRARLPVLPVVRAVITEILTAHSFATRLTPARPDKEDEDLKTEDLTLSP